MLHCLTQIKLKQICLIFSLQRVILTCHVVLSMTLKVQMSPSLRLFSRQNLVQPCASRYLLSLHGQPCSCHDLLPLLAVLSVIVQRSSNPIASQKAFGKTCSNGNHIGFSKQLIVHYISKGTFGFDRNHFKCIHMTNVTQWSNTSTEFYTSYFDLFLPVSMCTFH